MLPAQRPVKSGHYRPDIDGLRALAVTLVLVSHVQIGFYGGYIGVDVFFVISGYLISKIILSELEAGRFSIVRFYERRVRRILPALFVVLLFTTLLVYRYFTPIEATAYARSQLAALLSVSNISFWLQTGYFDDSSLVKPLLHTWSLAVEEQFYLVFPPLLILLYRFARTKIKLAIYLLALMSFLAAVFTMKHDSAAAFFLAPFRAWELLIGTIVSQRYLPTIRGFLARNIASALGLALILVPAYFYRESTPFPGFAAIPPCLGAALIIAAGEEGDSLVGSMLSWKPVVFIGLISYSLYLWHWPLLVFQRTDVMFFHEGLTRPNKLIFCAIAIAAGTLSWALVEKPFREGRFRPGRKSLFYQTAIAALCLVAISTACLVSHGFPNRFPPDAQAVAMYADYDRAPSYRENTCFLDGKNVFADFQQASCLTAAPGKPTILLAGDSHSAQLYPGISSVFTGDNVLQANVAGCSPLLTPAPSAGEACKQMSAFLFNDYLLHHHVDTLVLAARWYDRDLPSLTDTINFVRAHGIHVVIVGPGLEYDAMLSRLLAKAIRNKQLDTLESHRNIDQQQRDATMAHLAATQWHVPYISIYNDLCTPNCPVYAAPSVPLLFDSNHFTAQGSILLAHVIRDKGQLN